MLQKVYSKGDEEAWLELETREKKKKKKEKMKKKKRRMKEDRFEAKGCLHLTRMPLRLFLLLSHFLPLLMMSKLLFLLPATLCEAAWAEESCNLWQRCGLSRPGCKRISKY